MLVNMKETMDILDKSRVVEVKRIKPKNLTWTVHKGMSVRNAKRI
jgi:hypothetical protein